MNSNFIFSYCQQVLSNYSSIIYSIIGVLLSVALIYLALQLFFTNQFLKRYLKKRVKSSDKLSKIALPLKILDRVDVVDSKANLVFCYGILRPRIVLSSQLTNSLSDKQLRAVLLHESCHLKSYDPLKIVLSRTLSSIFFFIPLLKDLQRHYMLTKEIVADMEVIKYSGKEVLISVLSKLITSRFSSLNTIAALVTTNDLEKRILYLGGKQKSIAFQPPMFNIAISIFMVVALFIVISTPVYAVKNQEGGFCKTENQVNYSQHLPYTPLPN